jgi:signal transduction histidine kinase/DNA-binding response OmpR family regulator/ligand-binding sensor domain-containing protein
MRAYVVALTATLTPTLLLAQPQPRLLPFSVVEPGIVTRIERFPALSAPGTQITGMVEDQRGFLWCRTNRGLARFDGYELRFYPEADADTAGSLISDLQSLAIDGDNIVWGGTSSAGVIRFDPSTGQSRRYRGRDDDPVAIGAGANRLFVSSDGELWAAGKSGLARYDRSTDAFVRYYLPPDYGGPPEDTVPYGYPITSICELGRSIWIGLVRDGLAEFDRGEGRWIKYIRPTLPGIGLSGNGVRTLYPDAHGHLWIGSSGGLDRYDPRSGAWKHFSLPKAPPRESPTRVRTLTGSARPWSIVPDDFGGLWIAMIGSGVARFEIATGGMRQFRHDEQDANSIPSDFVLYLFGGRSTPKAAKMLTRPEAAYSIVWIPPNVYGAPSGMEGVHRAIVRPDPCTSVIFPWKPGTPQEIVCGLAHESPGKVWACVYTGTVSLLDLRSRILTRHGDSLFQLSGLHRLRDGTVLVFTRTHKARRVDPRQRFLCSFCPDLNVTRTLEESAEHIWLGCRSDAGTSFVSLLERHTGRFTVFPRQDADTAAYHDESVTCMCRDDRGDLWYGTAGGGVIKFDPVQRTYRRYAIPPGPAPRLPGNVITALVSESPGRIWVGTTSGVALFHSDAGTFEPVQSHLREGGELYVRDMVDDGAGNLWIAAHERVVCFTRSTRSFRSITPPPSFQTSTFWSVSYDTNSRTVAFGGRGGYFFFPRDHPPAAPDPPPIVLTSFKVYEKTHPLGGEPWSLRSIPLGAADNFFSFTFSALDYLDPGRNQYAYCLEGVDPDWVYAGTRRYASYTNLEPGRYIFKVRGMNSEGVWNDEGNRVEIVIPSPWYRTLWAYAAYIILSGGLLYAWYRYDRKRAVLKQSLERKEFETRKVREIDEMKSRFFANISHEFRTPLTLMLGPVDRFIERYGHDEHALETLEMMRRNGHRLLELINQLLDLSRLDAGKMRVQVRPLDLVEFTSELVAAFQSLAETRGIHLVFDPGQEEIIAYTDRDKFEKILNNLLSNAFKFTADGEIRVVLRVIDSGRERQVTAAQAGGRVELVVSDTGVGIDEEHLGKVFDRFYQVDASQKQGVAGTGLGLALTRELVDILRGDITVESAPGRGSVFSVRLPSGKAAWGPEEIATDKLLPVAARIRPLTEPLSEVESPEAEGSAGEPGRPVVLVVDDNLDVRRYLCEVLRRWFAVEEAGNGEEALHKTREMPIDLVISDVMMPVMDGVRFCREIQTDERTNHIPVILLTARATTEGRIEGLDAGADDYVIKPFDVRELAARVRNLIASRRKLWEKYHRQVTLGPADIPVTSADERFLKRFSECMEQHLADSSYDTEALAHDLCMSRMQLNRKLHALTGHSTHLLVRQYRLRRAARLLRERAGTVSEAAFESGFNNLSHFARAFREEFGVLPSDYRDHPPEA